MKEKIYTIPITESYEQDCECPFCFLEKKLEQEAVQYALGAAMMEPDYRIISNEKGYCNKHFSMMFSQPNKLSLALVLETHLQEVIQNIKKYENELFSSSKENGGIFRKKNVVPQGKMLAEELTSMQQSCVICDKIATTLKRYTEVFFYMWNKEEDFRNKVKSSKGYCLKHFSLLCDQAYSNLKNPNEFVSEIYKIQLKQLESISKDIHKFTLKFDYRNKDMEWGTAIDAPFRTIEKLRGYIVRVEGGNN